MTSLLSSLVSKMDAAFGYSKQIGENAHIEHSWNEQTEKLFVQYYFQLVRTDDHTDLENKFIYLVENIKRNSKQFSYLYKLICETRDIKSKQEYALGYMQLAIFYEYYPKLALEAFKLYCISPENDHPYGSWKDVKYMCNYIREKKNLSYNEAICHPFIKSILDFAALNLKLDIVKYSKLDTEYASLSLISKWLPREKSAYKWLYTPMAKRMFPDFSTKKAKTHYRKILSKLNKYLDTVQIKMCNKNWRNINFNNVTSITLERQKNAILNIKGKKIRSQEEDRIICASNYVDHMDKVKSGDKTVKIHGKNCSVGDLVKHALRERHNTNKIIHDTINEQWKDNSKNNQPLGNIISCADTSGSMEIDGCIPLYNSMGLAIRTSEICHDAFKNRVLTFDAQPQWVKFKDDATFCEKVWDLKNRAWGTNTDFYKMLDMILHVLVTNNIPQNEVKDLILVVFSDMQFDSPYHNLSDLNSPAGDVIRKRFADLGYTCPHLLFWNLRKTTGFPDKTTSKNVSFISGYSSHLLNIFVNKGFDALQQATPFDCIQQILNKPRYDILDTILNNSH